MQWDSIALSAKKLGALLLMTGEISEDAIINLGDEVAHEVAWAFAVREDQCGFIGDGTSTYKGMVGVVNSLTALSTTVANIAGLTVATGAGYATNYNSMILGDLHRTLAKLPAYADNPSTGWFMHRNFYYGVASGLMSAEGQTAQREPVEPYRPLLLGIPVNFVQVMPYVSAVNQVVALVGDMTKAATFGDRRQVRLFRDPYSLSTSDQVRLIGFERFDINVTDVGNASATAADRVPGPVVGLITAAS
jgi:HK97 family phage major capsid protein